MTIDPINGIAEDLGALLGHTRACLLMDLYGGEKIYIPKQADPEHHLALLLGETALAALCREYGGENLKVPTDTARDRNLLIRAVAEKIKAGQRIPDIAETLHMSPRNVANYRALAERIGLLPLILGSDCKTRGGAARPDNQ